MTDLDQKMANAKNITIAIFNRIGDGVIAASMVNEFINKWNGKRFLVFTSPQLLPYIQEVCPTAEAVAFKKKNVFYWLRLQYILRVKYKYFDLGFNPYSYGAESKAIARMAAWSKIYANSKDAMKVNYYDRVRQYFELPLAGDLRKTQPLPESVRSIIICPDSSELRRTLTDKQLEKIIIQAREKWPAAKITLASGRPLSIEIDERFNFKKSLRNSRKFIKLIKTCDLMIAVDSGPLHIAAALNKKVIGFFSSAMPATVINANSDVFALRSRRLNGAYCEVLSCKNPVCMDELAIDKDSLHQWVQGDLRTIENHACLYHRKNA